MQRTCEPASLAGAEPVGVSGSSGCSSGCRLAVPLKMMSFWLMLMCMMSMYVRSTDLTVRRRGLSFVVSARYMPARHIVSVTSCALAAQRPGQHVGASLLHDCLKLYDCLDLICTLCDRIMLVNARCALPTATVCMMLGP